MKDTVLARRYARALFEIAQEQNILDSVHREIVSFEESLQTNEGFRLFLYSQDLSKKEKKEKLERVLQDRISNIFFNFLLVLLRKGRELIFESVAFEFNRLVDKNNRKVRATTTTAIPLDGPAATQLKSLLDAAFKADVEIQNRVDESILGGIIVNVDGQLLDGSIKNQLMRLASHLSEGRNGKT